MRKIPWWKTFICYARTLIRRIPAILPVQDGMELDNAEPQLRAHRNALTGVGLKFWIRIRHLRKALERRGGRYDWKRRRLIAKKIKIYYTIDYSYERERACFEKCGWVKKVERKTAEQLDLLLLWRTWTGLGSSQHQHYESDIMCESERIWLTIKADNAFSGSTNLSVALILRGYNMAGRYQGCDMLASGRSYGYKVDENTNHLWRRAIHWWKGVLCDGSCNCWYQEMPKHYRTTCWGPRYEQKVLHRACYKRGWKMPTPATDEHCNRAGEMNMQGTWTACDSGAEYTSGWPGRSDCPVGINKNALHILYINKKATA